MNRVTTPANTKKLNANLDDVGRKLLRLQTNLIEAHNNHTIPRAEYTRRAMALEAQWIKLEELKNLAQGPRARESDLGLPEAGSLSINELKLTNRLMDERLNLVKSLFNTLKNLDRWIQQASHGEGRGLKGSMRLSKFKKNLQEFEAKEFGVDNELSTLDQFLERMTGKFAKAAKSSKRSGDNFSALMTIYRHINDLSNRVFRLEHRVKDEEAKLQHMATWLEQNAKVPSKPMTPPSLNSLNEINLESEHLNPLEYNRKRLTIAQKFVQEFRVNKGEVNENGPSLGANQTEEDFTVATE